MKYCKKCLMPDTRPGIKFDSDDICYPCINYEKQKQTNWKERWKELENMCDKYRGSNGNSYDCAIAVSGGKDSHYQTYVLKEKLDMNPVLLTVRNVDWTKIGEKNLENISETFHCDVIQLQPNIHAQQILTKKAFEELGQPSWYLDSILYAFPYNMAIKLGVKFLVYGEDISYSYGGKDSEEKPSALMQPYNDVVKPYKEKWLEECNLSIKDLEVTKPPTLDECKKFGLEAIYLSYFVPWNSHHNYEVAKKWGFRHLGHEYKREGWLEDYDQIDSLSYMLNPFLKYLKFGHSVATDIGSRWIRYGLKTREEMITIVEENDRKLDQGIIDKFCEFTKITPSEFWKIMDKWYNQELFLKDSDDVWHPKFKVGAGLIK